MHRSRFFAAEGAEVAFFSRDADKAKAAIAAIDAAGPDKVYGEQFEMTGNPAGYREWLGKARDALGGCDIFIHAASSSGQGATGDWQRGLDMDVVGAVHANETDLDELGDLAHIVFRSFRRLLEHRTIVHGVSANQWRFRRQLWRRNGIHQRALAERLAITEATAAVSLRTLEKRELVVRRRNAGIAARASFS